MAINRKDSAVSFLQLAASGRAREAFDRFVGPAFLHHNPFFAGGAETLMNAMDENARQNPEKRLTVLRALEVKRVEPFREQAGAAQHYFPGTPDGSRRGVYYAHLLDMKAMPKHQLEVIAHHEGNPGHHMQISIAHGGDRVGLTSVAAPPAG